MVASALVQDGYTVFEHDVRVAAWAAAAGQTGQQVLAQGGERRHGATWFVGVDALPNEDDGSIGGVLSRLVSKNRAVLHLIRHLSCESLLAPIPDTRIVLALIQQHIAIPLGSHIDRMGSADPLHRRHGGAKHDSLDQWKSSRSLCASSHSRVYCQETHVGMFLAMLMVHKAPMSLTAP